MTSPYRIRSFTDLPSKPGAYEMVSRVGAGTRRRLLRVWWQRGEALRPCLAVTAMVHGDEFEGFAAALRVWEKLRGMRLSGSVLMIPVCNPWAAEACSRCSPEGVDGRNLARIFPGRLAGSPTQQIARRIWDLVSACDTLVDMHSGGAAFDFLPVTGFYREAERALAACFPIKHLWKIPVNQGVLSYEMSRRGKPVVGLEYHGRGNLDRAGAEAYQVGIFNLMRKLGMLAGERIVPFREKRICLRHNLVQHAPGPGWFFPCRKPGDRVDRGAILGEWVNDGLARREIRSRHRGILLAVRNIPRVTAEDAIAHFAR